MTKPKVFYKLKTYTTDVTRVYKEGRKPFKTTLVKEYTANQLEEARKDMREMNDQVIKDSRYDFTSQAKQYFIEYQKPAFRGIKLCKSRL